MTIANAELFIKRALKDGELRKRVSRTSSLEELQSVLEDEKMLFTPAEFAAGHHNILSECQFESTADQVKEFKMWWDILVGTFGRRM